MEEYLKLLHKFNPQYSPDNSTNEPGSKKVLVQASGGLAKEVFLSLQEEGIISVAIVPDSEIGQSWYEFANEIVYTRDNIPNEDIVIAASIVANVGMIYVGEGFETGISLFLEKLNHIQKEYNYDFSYTGPSLEIVKSIEDKEKMCATAQDIGIPCILTQDTEISEPIIFDVQIFNGTAIGIIKSSLIYSHDVIIEESGNSFLDHHSSLSMMAAAEKFAYGIKFHVGGGAAVVQFLYAPDTKIFWLQNFKLGLASGYSILDQTLGIDLCKWQLLLYDNRIQEVDIASILAKRFASTSHATLCRIFSKRLKDINLLKNSRILGLNLPTYGGIRCDFGYKKGDLISDKKPIGEIIAVGNSRDLSIKRLKEALKELYVKGLSTNIHLLMNIINHSIFKAGNYNTKFSEIYQGLEISKPVEKDIAIASGIGAIAEYIYNSREMAIRNFHSSNIENIAINHNSYFIHSQYSIELFDYSNELKIIQLSQEKFGIFFNQVYQGELDIKKRSVFTDDFYVRINTNFFLIRVDRRRNLLIIRMQDENREYRFFKISLQPIDVSESSDLEGLVRSPFTGSFVKLAHKKDKPNETIQIGDAVEQGDPLIIISTMKMETTISSPISGKVEYLIENGDLSKLQLGKTALGQVVGKIIQEKEILFIIKPLHAEKDLVKKTITLKDFLGSHSKTKQLLSTILDDSFDELVLNNPSDFINEIIGLIESCIQGFITDEDIIKPLIRLSGKIPHEFWETERSFLEKAYGIFQWYYYIRYLFYPNLDKKFSLYFELSHYIENFDNKKYRPSEMFQTVMDILMNGYDITQWYGINKAEKADIQTVLLYLQRSYQTSIKYKRIIVILLQVIHYISQKQEIPKKFIKLFKQIYFIEQIEHDDAIIKELIQLGFVKMKGDPFLAETKTNKRFQEYKSKYGSIDTYIERKLKSKELTKKTLEHLKNPYTDLNPERLNITPEFKSIIMRKLEMQATDFTIYRYQSALKSTEIYGLISSQNPSQTGYLLYSYIPMVSFDRDYQGSIIGSKDIERAMIRVSYALKYFQGIEKRLNNTIEVFFGNKEIDIELSGNDPSVVNYDILRKIFGQIAYFLAGLEIKTFIIHLNIKTPFDGPKAELRQYKLKVQDGKIQFDILSHCDDGYYSEDPIPEKDKRLYSKNKWPAEMWVKESFDKNSYFEVKIPSIDETVWKNPKTGKEEIKPVGSKIFIGKLCGNDACFYIKDSRISGGASGNLEGLKYIAAVYISSQKKIPIYVWNDGAGANIKEGVIALNRAGQGFMMNALIGASNSDQIFDKYTIQNSDPILKNLFQELETSILGEIQVSKPVTKPFMIAVGIGSSTGLDVYGSSQMAIQVMLDMEESYRVLTGSNVIRSVTGENFTNYEIGGAKVMGNLTGTVDFIAPNKLYLVLSLQKIQKIFCNPVRYDAIQRRVQFKVPISIDKDYIIKDEDIVQNIDFNEYLRFKDEYYGTSALTGGFARLGGIPSLILGMKTRHGIINFNA
ncbi:MAG: carboxyl transferase domain-containing protein, partial [Spirochaetota bacterium]